MDLRILQISQTMNSRQLVGSRFRPGECCIFNVMYCTNCGARAKASDNYCGTCGRSLPKRGMAHVDQDRSDADLYEEALDVVLTAGHATPSLIQHKLRIGYAQSARLMLELQDRGVIEKRNDARPRRVISRHPTEASEVDSQSKARKLGNETMKLFLLNLLMLGLYYPYWAYKRWALVAKLEDRDGINAPVYGLFAAIMNFSLFSDLKRLAHERADFNKSYTPWLSAVLFLLFGSIAGRGGSGQSSFVVTLLIYVVFVLLQCGVIIGPVEAYVELVNKDAEARKIDASIPVSVGLVAALVIVACAYAGLGLLALYSSMHASN